MIGIDTNILLRYLTNDDQAQVRRVLELFETGQRLLVSDVVLTEAVWVLKRTYRFSKEQIARALQTIIENETFAFYDPAVVHAAFRDYSDLGGDFADYLIGRRNASAGCEHTVTFEKGLAKHPAFVVL